MEVQGVKTIQQSVQGTHAGVSTIPQHRKEISIRDFPELELFDRNKDGRFDVLDVIPDKLPEHEGGKERALKTYEVVGNTTSVCKNLTTEA